MHSFLKYVLILEESKHLGVIMKLSLIIKAQILALTTLVANGINAQQTDVAYWKSDDCSKVSHAAALYLYTSAELLKAAEKQRKAERSKELKELDKLEEPKELKESEEAEEWNETEELHDLYEGALFYSELSANAAKNFQTFCKK